MKKTTISNLLEELKNHLDITWDYDNPKLTRWLKSGKIEINKLVGANLDYENNEDYKTLLFEYCRYLRSNSKEYFKNNYADDILNLQIEVAINEKNSQNTKE